MAFFPLGEHSNMKGLDSYSDMLLE